MSRAEFSGTKYDAAVGVDHVTGVFLQIWKKPARDQDGCFIKIEGKNLIIDKESEELKDFPPKALEYMRECSERMKRGAGDYISSDNICYILVMLGFEDMKSIRLSVFQILD